MYWDPRGGVFEGVPQPSDLSHHYITVIALGRDGSQAKDVFAIDVVEISGGSLNEFHILFISDKGKNNSWEPFTATVGWFEELWVYT